MLAAFGLEDGHELAYLECSSSSHEAHREVYGSELVRGCGPTSRLSYLNSGLLAGPVRALLKVLQGVLELYSTRPLSGAYQQLLAQYMSEHGDEVTLDYGAMLVSNLVGVELRGKRRWSSFSGETFPLLGGFVNSVTGRSVCFFHGHGPSSGKLQALQSKVNLEHFDPRDAPPLKR